MELVSPFLQHRAGDVDEGWDWGQTIDKYRAAPASQELLKRTSSFKAFMNKTLKESNDKTSQEAFYGKHSWTDVQNEAGEALALYKGKGRSWRHPFRSAGRVFSDSAYRMDFLLQLLPNGEYTSLLTGCFNLVYNAAKRFKYLRETVFGVFDSLSETIECSKSYIRTYSEDSELRTKAEALFIAILEAVEAITHWIKRNPGLEAFKSFFQQDAYGSQLEGKITTNIQEKATAFDDRVRACLHTRIRGIHIGVTTMGKDVKYLTKSVNHLSANILSIKASVETKPEKQELAMERLEDLLMGIAKEAEWTHVKLENAEEERRKSEKEHQEREHRLEEQVSQLQQSQHPIFIGTFVMPSMPSLPPQFVTADQLRQILNANSAYPDDDLVLEYGDSIESQRKKCIPWVMANELFQAWLRQAQSQILVINSMTDDIQEHEAITPLSCVCVLLGRILRRLPSCAALTFYCGLHASPGDNLEGGNGIMRSLIYQVLQKYGDTLNLSFLSFQILQQIQGRDLATLCICFQRLLESVGTGVVVCLIDEISWYETDSRSAEMEFVMRFLNNLVADVQASGGGFVFKVLVTASTVSQYSRIWFPDAWTILVEDDFVPDGQDSDEMQFLMA